MGLENFGLSSVIFIVVAYLIGSFPSGLIIGKMFYQMDIREHGSGNLGGTNALRVLGKKGGAAVYALDILKGGIAVLIAMHLQSDIHPLIIAIFSLVGHVFPIFAGFKGGKAVATSGGIILFYSPILFVILLIIFTISLKIWKMVSLSSTIIAIIMLAVVWINPYNNPNYDLIGCIVFSMFAAIVFIKHIPNYKRIIKGTENKVNF